MAGRNEKALRIADGAYNRALDAAKVRDLSGAADLLRTCLAINKEHTAARDLLGLIFYERGEVGSALLEWTISLDLDPTNERAARYLDDCRHESGRLQSAATSLTRYNRALENAKQGNDDAAAVELRRALTQNPKLVRGWQLLALIEMHNGRTAQAARMLRRASRIDGGSGQTHRLIHLLNEETGAQSDGERRRVRGLRRRRQEGEETAAPRTRVLSAANSGFLNLLIGAGIGILATWVLFAPAKVRRASSEANARIVEYTNTIAAEEQQIKNLQEQIGEFEDTVQRAREELEQSERESDSYVDLLLAYQAYRDEDFETAGDALLLVDETLLADEARAIYNRIQEPVMEEVYEVYASKGENAFDNADYEGAIPYLEKAHAIRPEEYMILNELAHAYRYSGDAVNALKYFQEIVDEYPDSRRAESVMNYLNEMKAIVESGGGDAATQEPDDSGSSGETEPLTADAE